MKNGEMVPAGLAAYLEGNGPRVELDQPEKRPVTAIIDEVGLGIHGIPNFDNDSSLNDLAENAYLEASEYYRKLPDDEKAVTSVGAIAIKIYMEASKQLGQKKAAPPLEVASERELPDHPALTESRIIRSNKIGQSKAYIPYDLDLPGLGSIPSSSGIDVEMSYFLASGESTTANFMADWLISQYDDFPRVWTLVFDTRRPETENLPEIPKMPQKCRIIFSDGQAKDSILVLQSVLELDIGKLKIWVIGESDG